MWRHLPGWLKKGLAGVAIALAVLAVFELLLRPVGPEPHASVVVSDDGCYFGWDANTFERLERPGLAFDLRTDERGFRVEGEAQPPRAACELLAVGDSFTEGMFVRAAEAWPKALERQLAQAGYSIRVRNGGMRGHTITHERVAALARWPALEPRVVLVSHTANDLLELHGVEEECAPDSRVTSKIAPGMPPLIGRTRIVRLTQDIGAQVAARTAHGPQELDARACRAAADRYAREARGLIEGVARWGGRVVFVETEDFHCRREEPDFSELRASLRAALRARGGVYVDARDALRAPEATLRPLDSHPSAEGHRRIASYVGRALLALQALDACR